MSIALHIADVHEPYWSMQALLDMSLCAMDSFGALQYGSCMVPAVAIVPSMNEVQECTLFWGVWWGALLLVRLWSSPKVHSEFSADTHKLRVPQPGQTRMDEWEEGRWEVGWLVGDGEG